MEEIRTSRLVLRRWRADDRAPFAALNRDPEVMEYFPSALTVDQSDAFVDRIEAHFAEHDFGLWALDTPVDPGAGKVPGAPSRVGSGTPMRFAGYVGLWPAGFVASFTPAVEIGWRLARHAWGHGYAPEAAMAAAGDGFARVGLDEIVSFTAVANMKSRRVMEKIGMTHDPAEDFDHPNVTDGHPLERHVLYRLRPEQLAATDATRSDATPEVPT